MVRKDSKGYNLRTGEYQRKDKRYAFSWTDRTGKRNIIYRKTLVELRDAEKRDSASFLVSLCCKLVGVIGPSRLSVTRKLKETIRAAQLARGAKLATSPVKGGLSGLTSLLVPLFTSAFRHADTLSAAMDARCYHGALGRTRLNPLHFEARDALALAALVALLALTIATSLLL